LAPPPGFTPSLAPLSSSSQVNYQHAPLPPTPIATKDQKHPTSAVYRLMAREIGRGLVTRYELGVLSKSRECKV
ncbi:hypothetical protein D7X74_42420, partial [Corallococcus sp. CA047B]